MIRALRYRLHPNVSQTRVLENWRKQCCSLYNACLEQRITWWRRQRKSITCFDQFAQLTELRAVDLSFATVPAEVQRSALRRLDLAYQAFFRRLKTGEKPGFPRFRSIRRYDSIDVSRVSVKKDRVHLPKLGHVKMNLHRPIEGTIKRATIRRDSVGKWWISFQCDIGPAPEKPSTVRSIVGIDLGLTTLATLSTGEQIPNHRFTKRSADQLAIRQRRLTRKKKGSKNREKARVLVAKAHAHVASQRLDHCWKEANKIVDRFDVIAHEKLNIKGLARGKLSKSFHDAAWGIFLWCLASKAEEAGKHLVPVDPRQTSQLCSRCGRIVKKTLADRVHTCVCGLTIDRDYNAAIVVEARGRRALELMKISVEGEASRVLLEARPHKCQNCGGGSSNSTTSGAA